MRNKCKVLWTGMVLLFMAPTRVWGDARNGDVFDPQPAVSHEKKKDELKLGEEKKPEMICVPVSDADREQAPREPDERQPLHDDL